MAGLQKLRNFFQSRTLRYGVPFLALVLGGSFGLQYFASLRYEFRKNRFISPKELEALGDKVKKPGTVTLEKVYEDIQKMDIDNWRNKRGPRPWEPESEGSQEIVKRAEERQRLKQNN